VLPAGARDEASTSIAATLEAARTTAEEARAAGEPGAAAAADALADTAREAFVSAMHLTAVGTAAAAAVAAAVVLVWMPGRRRPGAREASSP
jgi:hypothetical protein